MSLIPSDTLAVMKAHVANHHHLALADVEWLFQEIDALTAERDRLRDLAAALEAELARVSMICATHGIDPDGCTDCFVETTADVPHPPVTHQGNQP